MGSARISWVGPSASIQMHGKTRMSFARCDGHEHRDAVEHATAEDDMSNMMSDLASAWAAARREMVVLQ